MLDAQVKQTKPTRWDPGGNLEFCDVAFILFLTYTYSVVIANQCQMPDARPPQWKGRKASFGARLAPSVNKVHVIAHS